MSPGNIKRTSLKQEQQMAADLGHRLQPNSGAVPGTGGDTRNMGKERGEAKFTEKKSYHLRHADLLKLRAQALRGVVESPVMQVAFVDATHSYKYAIIPWEDYLSLREDASLYRGVSK